MLKSDGKKGIYFWGTFLSTLDILEGREIAQVVENKVVGYTGFEIRNFYRVKVAYQEYNSPVIFIISNLILVHRFRFVDCA